VYYIALSAPARAGATTRSALGYSFLDYFRSRNSFPFYRTPGMRMVDTLDAHLCQHICRQSLYTESWPVCGSLKHFIVSNPILTLDSILEKLPNVTVLELEGSTLQYDHTTMPRTLTAVSEACNKLTEVLPGLLLPAWPSTACLDFYCLPGLLLYCLTMTSL
jgi:hypothetical protein